MYKINNKVLSGAIGPLSNIKYLRINVRFISQEEYIKRIIPDPPPTQYDSETGYPVIEDVSKIAKFKKIRTDWYEKIKKLPTVEQKVVELNMPKYYGYSSVLLKNETLGIESLNFIKFITRTQVIEKFPTKYYEQDDEKLNKLVNLIKKPVEDLILLHFKDKIFREYQPVKELTAKELINQNFITDLNILMMKYMKDDISHLSPSSVDLQPRIEGFWFVGGFEFPNILKKRYEKSETGKQYAKIPYNKNMRSSIRPALVLRTGVGLAEVVSLDSVNGEFSASGDVMIEGENHHLSSNEFNPLTFSPRDTGPVFWGLPCRRRRAVIVPGFWPGEKDEYGHTFFHTRAFENHKWKSLECQSDDVLRTLLVQKAALAGFTQALSYAFYQGFTPVNELTYPVVQQLVSTDGQKFQFGVYQLNTCCLHSELSIDNPRRNFLWLSEDVNLYDGIEGDSVKGLNLDVLKKLCSFYLKEGEAREDPSPYLAPYKYLMHHDAPEEYKEEFHKQVHHLLSERPRHFQVPEVKPWEKIYKIYYKTMFQDKKREFFENRWAINPYTRRLDDYKAVYIPKVRRIKRRITAKPRIDSEHLFRHDFLTLRPLVVYDDDEVVYKRMNIRKDIPPYFNGLLWSRALAKQNSRM